MIGRNLIGDKGIDYLTRNEKVFPKLTMIQLYNNQIGDKGMDYLTQNDKAFPLLTDLNLGIFLNNSRREPNR